MMESLELFILVLLFVGSVSSVEIPSYIKKCSKSDPNISKCLKEHGNEAIPHIIKGEKVFGIPNLTPLVIPEVSIDTNVLKMKANKVLITGMETVKIKNIYANLEERLGNVSLNFNYINISSDFEVNSELLVFKIKGNGPIKIDLVEPTFFCDVTWDLVKKIDKENINLKELECKNNAKRIYFDLKNFFGGNEALGEATTTNLNTNWEVLNNELTPVFIEIFVSVFKDVINNIIKNFDYNEIVLP